MSAKRTTSQPGHVQADTGQHSGCFCTACRVDVVDAHDYAMTALMTPTMASLQSVFEADTDKGTHMPGLAAACWNPVGQLDNCKQLGIAQHLFLCQTDYICVDLSGLKSCVTAYTLMHCQEMIHVQP